MLFPWNKTRRRQDLLAGPFPAAWRDILTENVRHYRHLPPDRQATMRGIVQVLVSEQRWEGGRGFEVTEPMKVTVAGQASLLVLGLDEPYYFDQAPSVILYPAIFRHPYPHHSGTTYDHVLSGEAWKRGPVILSWEDALRAGRNATGGLNVALHEFAHHVDGLNGDMDGTPPILDDEQLRRWNQVTEMEFGRLVGCVRRGETSLLDDYGATSLSEFFAVATETFFERPRALLREHRELYGVLEDFYRQNPVQWLPDAKPLPADAPCGHHDAHRCSCRQGCSPHEGSCDRQAKRLSDDTTETDALFTLAYVRLEERKYDEAEELLSRLLTLDPTDGEAYGYRATARLRLHRPADALADSDAALRLDPDDLAARRARAESSLALRRFEEAKADFDAVLAETTNDAQLYHLRGLTLLALRDPKRAAADFTWALTYDPYLAEAWYQRAKANRELGEFRQADSDQEKAFKLDPLVDRRD